MKSDKYEVMMEQFPHVYADRHKSESCMGRGICCGEGWYDLLYDLSEKLEDLILAEPEEKRADYAARQVKEKFGCYDEQTEVLTENGWKYFKDLLSSDRIACLAKDQLVYELPTDMVAYHYAGDM